MGSKQLLASNSYEQYPKYLGYHIGVNETLLLSVYCDKDNWCNLNIQNFDGWFYALQTEVFIEVGLSEKQQTLAIKHLKELQLISVKKAGNPAKTYYKINENVLENVLEIAYNQYLSAKRQFVASSTENLSPLRNDKSLSLHINNNNIKNNNIKKSEPQAQPITIKNSRRNFREKVKPLEDLLNSGEIIDNYTKSKKKSKREKDIEQCLEMIQKTNYSEDTKDLLTEYFLFISDYSQAHDSESRLKVTSKPSVWETKLNKLNSLVCDGYNVNEIIKQSLEQKKYVFFQLQGKLANHAKEGNQQNVVMSDPEYMRKRLEEDESEEWY